MGNPPQTPIGFRSFCFFNLAINFSHSKKVLNQIQNTGFVAILFALRAANK